MASAFDVSYKAGGLLIHIDWRGRTAVLQKMKRADVFDAGFAMQGGQRGTGSCASAAAADLPAPPESRRGEIPPSQGKSFITHPIKHNPFSETMPGISNHAGHLINQFNLWAQDIIFVRCGTRMGSRCEV